MAGPRVGTDSESNEGTLYLHYRRGCNIPPTFLFYSVTLKKGVRFLGPCTLACNIPSIKEWHTPNKLLLRRTVRQSEYGQKGSGDGSSVRTPSLVDK